MDAERTRLKKLFQVHKTHSPELAAVASLTFLDEGGEPLSEPTLALPLKSEQKIDFGAINLPGKQAPFLANFQAVSEDKPGELSFDAILAFQSGVSRNGNPMRTAAPKSDDQGFSFFAYVTHVKERDVWLAHANVRLPGYSEAEGVRTDKTTPQPPKPKRPRSRKIPVVSLSKQMGKNGGQS